MEFLDKSCETEIFHTTSDINPQLLKGCYQKIPRVYFSAMQESRCFEKKIDEISDSSSNDAISFD